MVTLKKTLVISSLLVLTGLSNTLQANNTDLIQAKEGSLKQVMQGLLIDTQQLTKAMLMEDFKTIETLANNIANHPKPSLATRMTLMKAMGKEMANFKSNDDVVHGAAVAMAKNANQQDLKAIAENFQTMIGGCISCHSEFKTKVAAILK
ncbi:hypothetical protein NBRC116592_33540 [Colwellia sp. KU-HH00111]|uniref:cytochrome c n=1 Tax=Colwellia sp. KU-HH00111 TaxID=3127652 RepID=UPI003102CF3D